MTKPTLETITGVYKMWLQVVGGVQYLYFSGVIKCELI